MKRNKLKKVVMFTQSCFIKSIDASLIQKLERIGYIKSECCSPNGDSIVTNSNSGRYTIINSELFYNEDPRVTWNCDRIDCKDNEKLFLAIAALRNDDMPDYQWFVWDDDEDFGDKFKQYIPGEHWEGWWWFEVHKASVKELIRYHANSSH